jgi:hypothetical protein
MGTFWWLVIGDFCNNKRSSGNDGKAVKDLTAEAQRALRKKELVLFMESILCDLGVLRASAVNC